MPKMQFPILAAALPEKQRSRLMEAAEVVERCIAAQLIPNPVYQDLKSVIARAFEDGWRRAVLEPFVNQRRYEQLPMELRPIADFSAPQAHTAASQLRKVEAVAVDHPFRDATLAYLREVVPLAEGVVRLKPFAKKREVRPPEEIEPGYRPPHVGTEAQRKVLALLEDVTAGAHDELKEWFTRRYGRYLVTFLDADRAAREAGQPPLEPYRLYNSLRSRTFNPEAYDIIERTTRSEGYQKPYLPLPDAESIIAGLAERAADDVRRDFVHKNFAKIASICDRKGNFAHGEVVGRDIDLGGLRGTLRFHFDDGSRFTAQNSVVWSTSIHGKPFRRFPLTFHEAYLSGNVRMARPDEESMNDVFAAAASSCRP